MIVKVVNPTEEPATLRIKGDWKSVSGAAFEYYAPGSPTGKCLYMNFLSVRPDVCRRLLSDSNSRWTPLALAV